ncbi:MAG TPA: hypothetical protein PLV68_18980 [Ilumatobacteraceae bacterium]|nr:hypothetical protein [Ilumatobacteraceae bacterium]
MLYFGTVIQSEPQVVPPTTSLKAVSPIVLAAACRNYSDWAGDRVVTSNITIVDSPRLLRSAELLSTSFLGDQYALQAENLLMEGLDTEAIVARLEEDGASNDQIARAKLYLDERELPPSESASQRAIIYAVAHTAKSVLVVRFVPADVSHKIDKPLSRVGPIRIQLPDGSVTEIEESTCWR